MSGRYLRPRNAKVKFLPAFLPPTRGMHPARRTPLVLVGPPKLRARPFQRAGARTVRPEREVTHPIRSGPKQRKAFRGPPEHLDEIHRESHLVGQVFAESFASCVFAHRDKPGDHIDVDHHADEFDESLGHHDHRSQ